MRALTVAPGVKDSVRVDDIDEPDASEGSVLVDALAVGLCGTDEEIVAGAYGEAMPERERLVIGHESLGRVREAPADSGLKPGDLVVGIVRHPDPAPCFACAAGEPDMCRNGGYTERGIQGRNGFAAERFRLEPRFAVPVHASLEDVGMLIEPASVLAKAWEHTDKIGARAAWRPRSALIIGAGPIGLLAALFARQRGLEVHVLDRNTEGPKPLLSRDLGAHYHTSTVAEACPGADITIECTGVDTLILDAVRSAAPGGVVCLTGLSSNANTMPVAVAALGKEMVLRNQVLFGTVNANRRHYELAAQALMRADQDWLRRLITRRLPLAQFREALQQQPDDVKTVLELAPR